MKTLDRTLLKFVVSVIFLIGSGTAGDLAQPVPTSSPTPVRTSVQTLDDLRSAIRQRLSSANVQRGHVGVKIVSLATDKVIFESDSEKYFTPASNMKNFTVAAALEKLGPDFRFVTSFYAAAKPDSTGTIKGDLRVFGRGDVSISTAFNNGDYYKGLDNLADKIVAAGVRRVEGNIVGDESYFKGFPIPLTWEWNDLQWYDGAEVSALPLNDNSVDLNVIPGVQNGPCIVSVLPATPLVRIVNTCVTSGTRRALKVFKPIGENVLEISGSMPVADKGFTGYIAYTHPAELFVTLLKQRLALRSVVITGAARTISEELRFVPVQVEIARLESPPFSIVAGKTMKPSQNMYTETILWTLGERFGRLSSNEIDSEVLGTDVVKDFMKQIGVPVDSVVQYDGSGMSRRDLATPSAIVKLYSYMAKQSKYVQQWRDSLAIGGVDGTLKSRFAGTPAVGNFRGKTGTLDQVSALSGYLTTAAGEQVIVSVMVNDVPEVHARTSLIDDMVVQLANFNGRID